MQSSYQQNNYADVFYSIVTGFKLQTCVEIGVLDGYSTIAIASALKYNKTGHLDAYDLFLKYSYKHASIEAAQENINKADVADYVTLYEDDAFEVYKKYKDDSVYFLHVDISNDGDVIKKIVELWHNKLVIGGLILFEGGSEERDNIEWMQKYNKKSIKQEIESNKILNTCYVYATYLKWPSLTVCLKKRN